MIPPNIKGTPSATPLSRDYHQTQAELLRLFSDKLNIMVPSMTTDLFESGVMDSQKFVELLLHIEEEFNTQISVEKFEIDNFRSIAKMASLICSTTSSLS